MSLGQQRSLSDFLATVGSPTAMDSFVSQGILPLADSNFRCVQLLFMKNDLAYADSKYCHAVLDEGESAALKWQWTRGGGDQGSPDYSRR